MQYYFDTLPLHPPPEKWESFTSYLTRLAEMNNDQIIPLLAQTCLSGRSFSAIQYLKDFPADDLWNLRALLNSEESALKVTTFFHLGKKFGRPYKTETIRPFLSSSVASSLRYCPACLQEHAYYSLLWRFLPLQGCIKHFCCFLNKCGHCGQTIPIFTPQCRVGTCPTCKGNLSTCDPLPLRAEEFNEACIWTRDLEFLLSPQVWEDKSDILAQYIGASFASQREKRGFTIHDAARKTRLAADLMAKVEFEYADAYAASFDMYAKCAKCLQITFRTIFGDLLTQLSKGELEHVPGRSLSSETIIEKITGSAQTLTGSGKHITHKAILQNAHLTYSELAQDPSVKRRFREISHGARSNQKQQQIINDNKIRTEINNVIEMLTRLGETITHKKVCNIVGLSFNSLKRDISIIRLLNDCMAHYTCQKLKIEERYITIKRVEIAIDQLKELEEPLTLVALEKIIQNPSYQLTRDPQIQHLLQDVPRSYRQYQRKLHENDFLARAQRAGENLQVVREDLQTLGVPITRRTLCEYVGLPSNLSNFPEVASHVKQILKSLKVVC
jgi:hypothetical protein